MVARSARSRTFSRILSACCVRHVSIEGAPCTLNSALPLAKEFCLIHPSALEEDDPQLRWLRLNVEMRDMKLGPFRSLEMGVLARPLREPMLASEHMRSHIADAELGANYCMRIFDVNYDVVVVDDDNELMRAFYVPTGGLLQVRVPGMFLLVHRARAASAPYTIVRQRREAPPPKDPRTLRA